MTPIPLGDQSPSRQQCRSKVTPYRQSAEKSCPSSVEQDPSREMPQWCHRLFSFLRYDAYVDLTAWNRENPKSVGALAGPKGASIRNSSAILTFVNSFFNAERM